MVVSDHNQPAKCIGIVLLNSKNKAFDAHNRNGEILIRVLHGLFLLENNHQTHLVLGSLILC